MNAIDFDGMVVQNDLMAIGALKALRERGYKIPDEVKVIGYDNVFITTLVSPSITSIHIPKQRLGEEAARYLIQEIEGVSEHVGHKLELPLSLIERQTTNAKIPENWDLFLA